MTAPHKLSLFNDTLQVELLPRAAYSGSDPAGRQTLGVSLERQCGVHAIASSRRTDFDIAPGMLAFTPAGVDVFSESSGGGEYLLIRWTAEEPLPQRRVQHAGDKTAFLLARRLRRHLLCPGNQPEMEVLAAQFVGLHVNAKACPVQLPGPALLRTLERIADEFDRPLSLAQLAEATGMSPLGFLRDFTRAVGISPHAYLVETRLKAARQLLSESKRSLADVAHDCGFAHQSHLGSAFLKEFGMTPGQYRNRQRGSGT